MASGNSPGGVDINSCFVNSYRLCTRCGYIYIFGDCLFSVMFILYSHNVLSVQLCRIGSFRVHSH